MSQGNGEQIIEDNEYSDLLKKYLSHSPKHLSRTESVLRAVVELQTNSKSSAWELLRQQIEDRPDRNLLLSEIALLWFRQNQPAHQASVWRQRAEADQQAHGDIYARNLKAGDKIAITLGADPQGAIRPIAYFGYDKTLEACLSHAKNDLTQSLVSAGCKHAAIFAAEYLGDDEEGTLNFVVKDGDEWLAHGFAKGQATALCRKQEQWRFSNFVGPFFERRHHVGSVLIFPSEHDLELFKRHELVWPKLYAG